MLEENKIVTLGGQLKRGIQHLGYSSSIDTVTEVITDGYFNVYREYITKGDIITFIDTANLKVHTLRIKNIPLNGDVLVEELAVNESEFSLWESTTDYLVSGDNVSELTNNAGYLTSHQDLSSYVPYTGATTDVDLGANDISTIGVVSSTTLDLGSGGDFSNLRQLRIHSATSNAGLRITNDDTGTGMNKGVEISLSGNDGAICLYENADLKFYTNNIVRMTLSNTGGLSVIGNITGGNLSGTNTGDQDLSGYVPYTGATNDVNLGSNDLFVGGNVGIGTTEPTAVLHLKAGTATASTAPLKFTAGTALTTTEAGVVEFHDSRFYITNCDHRRAIDRTSDVALTSVSCVNTTTETTLWTGEICNNDLKVGNIIKIEGYGQISSASASDICTLNIYMGSTLISTIDSPGKSLSDDCWDIQFRATVRSVGETGVLARAVFMEIEDDQNRTCGTTTIDTTADSDITIKAQWNAAKAGNTIGLGMAWLEFKN